MTLLRTRRLAALTVIIGIAALGVAACGSSSGSSASSTASGSGAAAAAGSSTAGAAVNRSKFAACLKAHGVTLPARPPGARQRPAGGGAPNGNARPGSGGAPGFFFGGGGGGAGRGRFANNPKFRAAFQACGGARNFPRRRATLSHAAVTKFTACVKQHGFTLPAPNFSGKGAIFPASISRNKKFQAAARPCIADLRPAGGPGGAGGAGPPASGTGTTTGA